MKCRALNQFGKPCQAHAMANGYCYRHNPEISDEAKKAASRKGGTKLDSITLAATATDIDTSSIEGMLSALTKNINDLRQGKVDARTSNALVQNVMAAIELQKISDLDARLTRLEKILNGGRGITCYR